MLENNAVRVANAFSSFKDTLVLATDFSDREATSRVPGGVKVKLKEMDHPLTLLCWQVQGDWHHSLSH